MYLQLTFSISLTLCFLFWKRNENDFVVFYYIVGYRHAWFIFCVMTFIYSVYLSVFIYNMVSDPSLWLWG